MNAKGWRPFWAALLAGLLVLVPLVGGTILLTRRTLRTKLASRPQSGVAIRQPKEENRLSLLVCTAPTETTAPGFLLLYLSASQNCIHALALPGELTVPFGTDEAALADCYRAAGPARCREALGEVFALPGMVDVPGSIAPLRLLRDGANLCTCAQDILDDMRWTQTTVPAKSEPAPASAQDNLTEPQKRIFALLEREEMRFEELAEKTGLTPDQLSGELTMMELDGLIEARAGRAYALKR